MPQATLEPTQQKTDPKIIGWEGLLVPYGVATNEQRQRVVLSPPQLRMRDLPMFVGYQDRTAEAHNHAKTGLASITRVWETRSEEHTSELQSRGHLVCRLLLEKKKKNKENT